MAGKRRMGKQFDKGFDGEGHKHTPAEEINRRL
jgi:hypothetical protein